MSQENARPDPYASATVPTTPEVPMPETGPRVLGFGAHESIARRLQDGLRRAGLRATTIAIADDAASDERLRGLLAAETFDAIAFGAFLTAQLPESHATAQSTLWFNRVLNLVHLAAPKTRLVLVRGPEHALEDIRRELAT